MTAHRISVSLAVLCLSTVAAFAAGSTTLYRGSTWIKKRAKVTGTYEIVERDGSRFIRLFDDFQTKEGPDLKLVLSPLTPENATSKTALDGALIIHELKSHKGAQEFEIPEGTEFSKYKSLLIHCEKYSKLWGATRLEKAT